MSVSFPRQQSSLSPITQFATVIPIDRKTLKSAQNFVEVIRLSNQVVCRRFTELAESNPTVIYCSLSFMAGARLFAASSGGLPLTIFVAYGAANILSTRVDYLRSRVEELFFNTDIEQAEENWFIDQRAKELLNNAVIVEDDWEALGGTEGVMCLDSEEDFVFV